MTVCQLLPAIVHQSGNSISCWTVESVYVIYNSWGLSPQLITCETLDMCFIIDVWFALVCGTCNTHLMRTVPITLQPYMHNN